MLSITHVEWCQIPEGLCGVYGVWWADQQESCHGDVLGSEYQYRCSVRGSMWSELKIRSFYTQSHMWVLSNVVQHPVSSVLDTSGMSDRTEHRCHRISHIPEPMPGLNGCDQRNTCHISWVWNFLPSRCTEQTYLCLPHLSRHTTQ